MIKYLSVLAFILCFFHVKSQNINDIRAALKKKQVENSKQKSATIGGIGSHNSAISKVIFSYLNITSDMDCKIAINQESYDLQAGVAKKVPVYQSSINYYFAWKDKDFYSDAEKVELRPDDKGKIKQLNLSVKEKYKLIEKRSADELLLSGFFSDTNGNMVSVAIDDDTKMSLPTLKNFDISKYEVSVLDFATYKKFSHENNNNRGISGSLIIIPHSLTADKEFREGVDWSCDVTGTKRKEEDYDHPVVNISWEEASGFCQWMTQTNKNYTYRLPTADEWLFAASCSVDTNYGEFPWALNENLNDVANTADASLIKNIRFKKSDITTAVNDNFPFTSPVGSFQANCIGLYDMGGNAAEWCSNDFIDAQSLDKSPKKMYRGGSYYTGTEKCKLNKTFGLSAQQRHSGIGFRIVREIK